MAHARELAPAALSLSGRALLFPAAGPAALVVLGFLPRFADHPGLQRQLHLAALLLFAWYGVLLLRTIGGRASLQAEVVIRRPHYLQVLTQSGVYVYWGQYYPAVVAQVPLIAAQLAFVYTVDALYSWAKSRRWSVRFAPVPIVLSTNLFLWFKDDQFYIQLVLVGLGVLSKSLFQWRRDGVVRHVFNPSSIALALASLLLLATGTTELTWASDIARTQDIPPYIHEVLFLLGLIVQLSFPVVLVTMSSVLTICLIGAVYTASTGVYLFTNTSVPAAVLLGSILLVTDPATSPRGRLGKVLFGASYGALVVASFPLLEVFGPYGYFDKLLPVPFLNLLVPSFERLSARITAALERLGPSASKLSLPWLSSPGQINAMHVAIWACAFLLLRQGKALGRNHEGRSLEFWERSCSSGVRQGCSRLHAFCIADQNEACHNFGLLLADGDVTWTRQPASYYLERGCKAGIAPSCGRLGDWLRRGEGGTVSLLRAAELYGRACDGGDGLACHNLAVIRHHGLVGGRADVASARALYRRACERGVAEGCTSSADLGGTR